MTYYGESDVGYTTSTRKTALKLSRRERLELRRQKALDTAAEADLELQRLQSRPQEPDEDAVISWNHIYRTTAIRVSNGKVYTFVALHAGDGGWYTTGTHSATGRLTWDELLDFIESRENNDDPIWIVSSWERFD